MGIQTLHFNEFTAVESVKTVACRVHRLNAMKMEKKMKIS